MDAVAQEFWAMAAPAAEEDMLRCAAAAVGAAAGCTGVGAVLGDGRCTDVAAAQVSCRTVIVSPF